MEEQHKKLEGKKIILGVTGSISAYKAAILLRLLVKQGATVKVIMTEAAKDFVGPLTFSTLSESPVLSELVTDEMWAEHVALGLWADLFVVAPASANTLAKLSHGLTDNLLSAVYLSCRCPVMFAPAMDEDMWLHPSTQNNISTLASFGNIVLPVEEGPLASGLEGKGRLAEPETILKTIIDYFQEFDLLLKKKILITAGPTHEAIDPVRFIGNHSSGKMGIRLAEQAAHMGAEVRLVLGPTQEPVTQFPGLQLTRVVSAQQMFEATSQFSPWADVFILAAAVADYKPESTAPEKIKKNGLPEMTLRLIQNPDIAAYLGAHKKVHQILCGFALETEHVLENASAKMNKKNMDMIVINSPKDAGAGFGHDTNKISILDKSGKLVSFELQSKKNVAKAILKSIIEMNIVK